MVSKTCSIYRNIFDTTSQYTISVEDALNRIKTGKSDKAIISLRNELDPNIQADLKKKLPSVTFSGVFTQREDSKIKAHSGFICLDFDDVDISTYKAIFSKWEFTYATWVSPRGNGVKALIKIADGAKHRQHFAALKKLYPDVDEACVNESRVCYESYDPEIFINEKSKVFKDAIKYEVILKTNITNDVFDIYKKLIRWLEKKGNLFSAGNRNKYVFILAGACCRYGLNQNDVENIMISDYSSNDFTKKEITRTINSAFKRNASCVSTLEFRSDNFYSKETAFEVDSKIFEEGYKPADVIYGSDVYDGALSIYNDGYTSAETTYIQMLDPYFKFKRGEITLLSGIGNYGKALALDTEIPVLGGWKKMGEIQKGDIVFDEAGLPCNVVFVADVMYGHKCYKITFNDGTTVIADADHDWVTDTAASRRSHNNAVRNNRIIKRDLKNKGVDQTHKRTFASKKTTENIRQTLIARRKKSRVEYNHSIPYCKPLILSDKDLMIPPYVLGAWLGDGTSEGGGFTSNDGEVIKYISEYNFYVKKSKHKYRYHIHGLRGSLVKYDLLKNKHIPSEYLRGSYKQRLELLQGLMDTDGYIDPNGTCEFCNTNKLMSYQVYELITSLGLRATINEYDAKLYGRFISKKYRINFKPFIPIFKLKRKLNKVKNKVKAKYRYIVGVDEFDSVPVKCISVDSKSHLYLCTKSFIATHNTSYLNQLLLIRSYFAGNKWAIFSPENYPAHEFYFDMTEALLGCRCDGGTDYKPQKELFEAAYEFVSKHFFYVYPESLPPTPEYLKVKFLEMIMKEKVDGVIIDPFNQMANDYGNGRTDKYLESFLSDFKRFSIENNIFFLLVAHPHKLQKNGEKNYPCPDVFEIADGAMWNNKCDNIIVYHRPFAQSDPESPVCEHHSKKIRRQKTVGKKGFFDFEMNRHKRRFYFDGKNPLDGNRFEQPQEIITPHPDAFSESKKDDVPW